MRVRDLILADYRRYRATGWPRHAVFAAQGFWASCVYRIAHAAVERVHGTALAPTVWIAAALGQKLSEVVTGVSLPAACTIGPGLYISHYGTVIVHPRTRIGENCNLSQGVTIGVRGRGRDGGAPLLGDRVHVAPNAIIVGPITIGDDAAIGPGAVVSLSIPAHGVASGNPATISVGHGSAELIKTDGRIGGSAAGNQTSEDVPAIACGRRR